MNKRLLVFALVAFFPALSWAAKAPAFRERTVEGSLLSLEERLKPGRALLLTFWATWCGPCIEELRSVKEQLAKDPAFPLDVVSVNVDGPDTVADVRPTMRVHGLDFTVVLDTKQEIWSRYQPSKALPYSVLIDAKGNIVATFQGYQETMLSQVRTAVAR